MLMHLPKFLEARFCIWLWDQFPCQHSKQLDFLFWGDTKYKLILLFLKGEPSTFRSKSPQSQSIQISVIFWHGWHYISFHWISTHWRMYIFGDFEEDSGEVNHGLGSLKMDHQHWDLGNHCYLQGVLRQINARNGRTSSGGILNWKGEIYFFFVKMHKWYECILEKSNVFS